MNGDNAAVMTATKIGKRPILVEPRFSNKKTIPKAFGIIINVIRPGNNKMLIVSCNDGNGNKIIARVWDKNVDGTGKRDDKIELEHLTLVNKTFIARGGKVLQQEPN